MVVPGVGVPRAEALLKSRYREHQVSSGTNEPQLFRESRTVILEMFQDFEGAHQIEHLVGDHMAWVP